MSTSNREILFELKNVAVGYGKKIIVQGVTFSVTPDDFIGLVGPNGAGKTTLLRTILGSLPAISGTITQQNVRFGYVPQRDTVQPLLPYTVREVVLMGRFPLIGTLNRPSRADKETVERALELVGIVNLRDANFTSLSGGQRQRVLIARALSLEPDVLVLDEPTNGMDTPSHYALVDLISRLHNENNTAIVLVSHLLTDVANVVKKIGLVDRNGFYFGPKEEVLTNDMLTRLYNSPMSVSCIEGEYVILPGKRGI
ncbi:MAG: metal ABC transporter ATP-binding protein [Ignavibacteria bacterium]|nr:metal ABC transporter ATP-binding protein [Ignavibacteria bacterium]